MEQTVGHFHVLVQLGAGLLHAAAGRISQRQPTGKVQNHSILLAHLRVRMRSAGWIGRAGHCVAEHPRPGADRHGHGWHQAVRVQLRRRPVHATTSHKRGRTRAAREGHILLLCMLLLHHQHGQCVLVHHHADSAPKIRLLGRIRSSGRASHPRHHHLLERQKSVLPIKAGRKCAVAAGTHIQCGVEETVRHTPGTTARTQLAHTLLLSPPTRPLIFLYVAEFVFFFLLRVTSGTHLSAESIAAADAGVASAAVPHNWLDNALGADDVTPVMVENAKSLWRVLPIFAVLPVFWMLFNQQVSKMGLCSAPSGQKRPDERLPLLLYSITHLTHFLLLDHLSFLMFAFVLF